MRLPSAVRFAGSEGLRDYFAASLAMLPWAVVTGIAMQAAGLSNGQAILMNVMVYAGSAQMAALPLLAVNTPIWVIVLTTLIVNLRFVIYSAAMGPGFKGIRWLARLLSAFLLGDALFVALTPKLLKPADPEWRQWYYLVPSIYSFLSWQLFTILGIYAGGFIPESWSLEFMATIALIMLLVPLLNNRAMAGVAVVGGVGAVLMRAMPLKTGLVAAVILGIVTGFLLESPEEAA